MNVYISSTLNTSIPVGAFGARFRRKRRSPTTTSRARVDVAHLRDRAVVRPVARGVRKERVPRALEPPLHTRVYTQTVLVRSFGNVFSALLQQYTNCKFFHSFFGMEARGEHVWTNDECMICKETTGPFPVLHPECRHGYCPMCLLKKEMKMCDMCKKHWVFTYNTHTTPTGKLIVARRVDGGFLYSTDIVVFSRDMRVNYITTPKKLAKGKNADFLAWMAQERLRTAKTVDERVRKYVDMFGPDAHSEEVGDGAWVVLGEWKDEDTANAAYITAQGVQRMSFSDTCFYQSWPKPISTKAVCAICDVYTRRHLKK